ncbi:hypothetical protein KIN20_030488 [Parelaphostrongylus tenuis]|uniref:GRIP domain-containing protein n=1 Tax=Parelaphostrongylus tenuis TaxID=148309 RepID=A0AAD5R447_PARTN|nr:hypothetical protein KIN20_030488 [Parelaphostrongylus tenuis]
MRCTHYMDGVPPKFVPPSRHVCSRKEAIEHEADDDSQGPLASFLHKIQLGKTDEMSKLAVEWNQNTEYVSYLMSEPQNTHEDAASEPSTSRGDSQEPIKGILKRPSLKYEDRNQILARIPQRPSPDRFADEPATRIPKLSVTWWEKNAVAIFGDTSDENNTDSEHLLKDLGNKANRAQELEQRQTAILDSEEDSENVVLESQDLVDESRDDSMSVASSTGSASSSVMGRYVPHCQKRGCGHNHSDTTGYLTPTQRRNKEISDLKNELRAALRERDEKERHLEELRERIKEVELLNIRQASLSDNHRLMMRERETAETFEREKKQIERRHTIRVNQLVHETLAARDEIVRLTTRIKELENVINVQRVDSETMTDAMQYVPSFSQAAMPLDPVDPNQQNSESALSPPPPPTTSTITPTATSNSWIQSSPAFSPSEQNSLPSSLVASPVCVESKVTGQQLYLSQEALNHIQACQNEAYIWRTKAAQLEIVVKDQLAKANRMEEALRAELLAARAGQLPSTVSTKSIAIGDDVNTGTPACVSPSECVVPSCIERMKNLIQEKERLHGQNESSNVRIHELEDDVTSLRHDLEAVEDHRDRLKHQLEVATKERDSKAAEVAACNIVIARHQGEKETMQKAIAYMEERMQVYQSTLMEHDIVVTDENSAEWRKGFVDPRYSVMVSKRSQTILTADSLSQHENEFALTKKKLAKLHAEFTSSRSDLHERFKEIEKILFTKTQVVDTLSRQLEETCRGQRQQIDAHQEERESYKKKLEEISSVAEKVPVLETQVEQLLKEKCEFDIRFSTQREEMEHALEEALTEALGKYKEQNEYWQSKHDELKQCLERAKAEIAQHVKEKEDIKLKAKLERADLENRLASSVDHVAMLASLMNKPCRDVECEARPRNVSKYVACRPNTRSKSTVITKGDLFDENEERLKLCQGELATTRRQVHVLQQKLISSLQDKAEKRLKVRHRIANIADRDYEYQMVDTDKFEALRAKNDKLCEQVVKAAKEKAELVRDERERIRHLVNEFENVRRELHQEMNRHESEKAWLRSRIRNLEIDNEELQHKVENRSEQSGSTVTDSIPIAYEDLKLKKKPFHQLDLRKTVSEPEIFLDSDEAPHSSAENIQLKRELDLVRNSLRHTAQVADRSHISPEFVTLADDLNVVKSDLENVLSSMDSVTKNDTTIDQNVYSSPSLTHSKSPAEEDELLQSDILKTVMIDWEANEKKHLIWDLKRSRQERETMKVYRREGIFSQNPTTTVDVHRFVRSSSTSNLAHDVADKNEVRLWKEKCGTMFRELNSMRSGYQQAQKERRELRLQLAMLRGELEIERCQRKTDTSSSVESSVYFSPRSRSCHSSQLSRRESRSSCMPAHISPPPAFRDALTKIVEKRGRGRSEQQKSARRNEKTKRRLSSSSSKTSMDINKFDDVSSMGNGSLLSQSWHESNKQRMVSSVDNEFWQPVLGSCHSRLGLLRERKSSSAENALSEMRTQLEQIRNEKAIYEKKFHDIEEERREMYLVMFKKGQQAAAMDMKEVAEVDQMTQDRVVLRFLHDAFYYYLMDKGNAKEHLQAIMAMLDFSMEQKDEVIRKKCKSH